MDTDAHGLKQLFLSVFIRVHPWPKCLYAFTACNNALFTATFARVTL
jgi:hypothetical protein